jgi:PAS domain S-box-containing protein
VISPASNEAAGGLFQSLFGPESEHPAAEHQITDLLDLLGDTGTVIGLDYLDMLAHRLPKILEVSHCLITQVVPERPSRMRTLAMYSFGKKSPTLEYAIATTPCEFARSRGLYHCTSGVVSKFPDDLNLVDLQADSYLGLGLQNPQQTFLGVICVMGDIPLPNPGYAERVMRLFSVRVGAELDRLRVEAESNLAHQRLSEFAQEVPGWVFAYEDYADGRRNLVYSNDGLEQLLGPKTAAKVRNNRENFQSLIHPDDLETARQNHDQLRAENGTSRVEYRVRTDQGQYRMMQVNRSFSGDDENIKWVHGIMLDVEDRRRLEQQQIELTRQLTTLLEAIPDAVILKDGGDRFQFLNPGAVGLLQLGTLDWKEQSFRSLAAEVPDAQEAFMQSAAHDLEAWNLRQRLDTQETLVFQSDGQQHFIEATRIPLFDQEEQRLAMVSVLRDITARINEQQRRLELENQYHAARRMEAMGNMANGVAHEFENLLTAVLGYTELCLSGLEREPTSSKRTRNGLLKIQSAAQHASEVARSLLAFARTRGDSRSHCQAPQILLELQGSLRHLAGRQHQFESRVREEYAQISISREDLAEILVHLITNAREALPSYGKIELTAGSLQLHETLRLNKMVLGPGSYYLIELSDNGVGISAHDMDRIFEPFFTTSDAIIGRGRGLSMVYGMVIDAGGGIGVKSRLGSGSSFRVYLPMRDAPPAQASTEKPSRILLVEDQPTSLELVCTILRASDFEVLPCSSIQQAKKTANSCSRLDLLLVNLILPDGNGADFATELQTSHPGLRVLFCSGVPAAALQGQGIQLAPGSTLIEKPFRPTHLLATVQKCLDSAPAQQAGKDSSPSS